MLTSFSIIIPVYNVEKYLVECVTSIFSQHYDNLEILLIDDGSTDGSGKLCDELARKHEKVRVIHKKNGGSADARNKGIEESTGEYLLFLDSDDYWEKEQFLFRFDEIIKEKKPDLIRFGVRQIDSQTNQVLASNYTKVWASYNSLANPYPRVVVNGHLTISACLHAVRRNYIIQNELFFKAGMFCEDIEWGIRVFASSPSIYFYPVNIYNYRYRREGSHTANTDARTLNDYCLILENGFEHVKNKNSEDWLQGYLMYQTIIAIAHTNYQKVNNETRKELNSRLRVIFEKNITKYKDFNKIKRAYLIYKFFGYRVMAKFLGWYLRIRGR
ncbi:MAG: glycosyltransferase family 2 protein [Victivallales bacterium]|nr:glycosyltransferase family 2 protein [Victivallales bacterium]